MTSVSAQESLADLITRIKPSVVKIIVYDELGKPIATGSGFFISKTKAITNKHVIAEAKHIEIKMFDGTSIYANKVQNVPDVDIAVLEFKSESKNIKPLLIAANLPREGDKIIVYGSPLGLEGSVSDGIVSATRKIGKGIYMQITAPISPGSSGSPVVDMSGRVVGIATLNIEGGQNLNFAIPAQQIASLWVNQISSDYLSSNNSIQKEVPKKREIDLTGNWIGLKYNIPYQIIDDGTNVSITRFTWFTDREYEAKWVGDVIVGYHNSDEPLYRYYFMIKVIDSGRLEMWQGGGKPTDSDEKIMQRLTKWSKGKPWEVFKRTR